MGRILRGPGTEFQPAELEAYNTAQNEIYKSLLPIAGLSSDPAMPAQ